MLFFLDTLSKSFSHSINQYTLRPSRSSLNYIRVYSFLVVALGVCARESRPNSSRNAGNFISTAVNSSSIMVTRLSRISRSKTGEAGDIRNNWDMENPVRIDSIDLSAIRCNESISGDVFHFFKLNTGIEKKFFFFYFSKMRIKNLFCDLRYIGDQIYIIFV